MQHEAPAALQANNFFSDVMASIHNDAVSSYASDIDGLILFIGVVVFTWFFIVQGVFFWMLWAFRHREGEKAQYVDEKKLKPWISIPHALVIFCDLFVVAGAIFVWVNVKQTLPDNPDHRIRVVAQQWAWTFIDAGPDGQFDTDDDITTVDEMHIESGTVYLYELQSRDVLHSFSVPAFRLKQDAVPGRTIQGWFDTLGDEENPHAFAGRQYDLQCAEMCGIAHGAMAARVYIHGPGEYAAWVRSQGNSQLANR